MSNYKAEVIPVSKYGSVSYKELGIECTYCCAGAKGFQSPKGELSVVEHYNPRVNSATVDGIVNGEKISKSFEGTYAFWAGCDFIKDLLKTTDMEPTAKPVYEQ